MKLLHCKHCGDVRRMASDWAFCWCTRSSGRYSDVRGVEIIGPCVAIECDEEALGWASRNQSDVDNVPFHSWVLPRHSPTVEHKP